jgi:predicted tellurium resistance membrane protein TerC
VTAVGRITPAKRQQRALAFDVVVATILAAILLFLAAGLGVVAAIALPVLLIGFLWIGLERLLRRNSHRRFRKPRKDQGSAV